MLGKSKSEIQKVRPKNQSEQTLHNFFTDFAHHRKFQMILFGQENCFPGTQQKSSILESEMVFLGNVVFLQENQLIHQSSRRGFVLWQMYYKMEMLATFSIIADEANGCQDCMFSIFFPQGRVLVARVSTL